MSMKSVNIMKQVRFGKAMSVFNTKQVNLYDFWIYKFTNYDEDEIS